jgi:hypothetical protein
VCDGDVQVLQFRIKRLEALVMHLEEKLAGREVKMWELTAKVFEYECLWKTEAATVQRLVRRLFDGV